MVGLEVLCVIYSMIMYNLYTTVIQLFAALSAINISYFLSKHIIGITLGDCIFV